MVDAALKKYLEYREIFVEMGVRDDFSVPRLHSIMHYTKLIRYFGAPNGLCSSITESKHIDAVKKPWRRSNRYNALGQMLKTNSRLDKLRASRISFRTRGMLKDTLLGGAGNDDDNPPPDDNAEDEDDELLDGPTVLNSVRLANTPRESTTTFISNFVKAEILQNEDTLVLFQV